MDRNYSEDINIDENNLEGEWLEQPSLMMYYSEEYANAIFNKDQCKVRIDYVSAQLDTEIRKNWEKFFDSKPTEAAIKNYILQHPKYRKVESLLLSATRDANLLSGVRSSFEHRKKALENLVSLRIGGFHSEPRNKQRQIDKGGHRAHKESLKRKRKRATPIINKDKED